MIGNFMDLQHVAFYTVAFFIGNVILVPARAIGSITSPLIAKAWKENNINEIKAIYEKSSLNQLLFAQQTDSGKQLLAPQNIPTDTTAVSAYRPIDFSGEIGSFGSGNINIAGANDIPENMICEDIGEKLGYSLVGSFRSMDEITLSNNSAYSDAPGNLLIDAYTYYVIIKKMHTMREGYAVAYINDNEMKKVKNQMGEIEKILVNEYSLDEDLLWDTAMKKYDKDYSVIDLLESTGIYTEDGNRVAMIALLSIDTIADEVIGSSSTKDF